MTVRIPLEFAASGSNKTVQEVLAIQAAIQKTAKESPGIERLASALGTNYQEARKLSQQLGLTAQQTEEAVQAFRQLQAVGADAQTTFLALAGRLGLTVEQIDGVEKAVKKYQSTATQTTGQNNVLVAGVAGLAFQFNNVVAAVQSLAAAAKPAYDFLIASNEKLNDQILRSQTNLASATRISRGGVEINDPTEKIKSTRAEIESALKQIEKDTENLVGVTSEQVNSFFDATLSNVTQLIGQSKKFSDPIQSATALTTGFAAAFKVVGLSADQVSSEIRAILTGEELDNSTIAKTLNLTRTQIEQYKQQGVLVDELNKKLQIFVSGNAIASRSIAGQSSNIIDLFQRLGREAGKPFLDPVVGGLEELFKTLKQNEAAIFAFFNDLAARSLELLQSLGQSFQGVVQGFGELIQSNAGLTKAVFELIAERIAEIGRILGPVLALYTAFIKQLIDRATDVVNAINTVGNVIENLAIIGGNAIQPIIQKFQELLGALKPVQDAAGNLVQVFLTQLGRLNEAIANSPIGKIVSKLLSELGKLAEDPQDKAKAAAKAAEEAGKKAAEASNDAKNALNIQGREAQTLGDTFTQLKNKSEAALRVINSGQESPQFQQAAKDLIELTQQQLELGQITQEEAQKRLSAVQNNTKIEVDTQQKAQEAIVNLRKEQIDNEIATIQAGQAQIEAQQISGNLSELEADRQLTGLKIQELQKRIEQQQAIQATGNEAQKKAAITEETKLQGEIAKVQAESRKRQSELRVKEILEANDKVETAIKQSQTTRVTATREAEIAALRQGGTDRERAERETQQKIAQIQLEGTNQELTAKKNALAQIQQARAAGQIDQKTAAEQEKQLINEIGQLNLQRLDAEKAKLQSLIAERIRAIDAELQRARLPLEAQAGGLSNVNTLLQQQSNLLSAQQGLETAIANLRLQRLNFALEDAKAAGDSATATAIQQEIFAEQSAQLEQQYQSKLAALDLSEKIKANELEIAKIQADIAVLEAEAAVKKAEAEGKSQQEIEALRQQLDLKRKIADLSQTAIANQDEINKKQREQLAVDQQAARERQQREQQQAQQQEAQQAQQQREAEQQQAATSASGGGGAVKRSFNLAGEQITQFDQAGKAFSDILAANNSRSDQQITLLRQLAGGNLNENEKFFLASKAEDNGFAGISGLAKQLENISQLDIESVIRRTQEAGGDVIAALQGLTKGADDASNKLGGLPSLQARRDGGSVVPGQPYLVGEEGPELIMPSRSGHVLTAQQTAALLGGVAAGGFNLPSMGGGSDPALLQEVRSLSSSIEEVAERAAYPRTLVVQDAAPTTSAARIWSEMSKHRVQRKGL